MASGSALTSAIVHRGVQYLSPYHKIRFTRHHREFPVNRELCRRNAAIESLVAVQ